MKEGKSVYKECKKKFFIKSVNLFLINFYLVKKRVGFFLLWFCKFVEIFSEFVLNVLIAQTGNLESKNM